MANENNLKPCEYKLSREEAKKGGIKSGETRREKKTMQQLAKYILSMPLANGASHSIEEIQSIADVKGKNLTVNQAIMLKQMEKALKGDLQSAIFIRDMAGEKPVDNINVSGEVNNPFSGLSTEELRKLLDD